MTLSELFTILKATGYPVAYSHFESTPSIPFITYLEEDSNNFHADNRTYKKVRSIRIELYTDKKDLVAEAKVEAVLDENEIPYQSYEVYIDSEKVFQKTYQIGVI
jgi:hypothetical protein